jgi:hypothetical protein
MTETGETLRLMQSFQCRSLVTGRATCLALRVKVNCGQNYIFMLLE